LIFDLILWAITVGVVFGVGGAVVNPAMCRFGNRDDKSRNSQSTNTTSATTDNRQIYDASNGGILAQQSTLLQSNDTYDTEQNVGSGSVVGTGNQVTFIDGGAMEAFVKSTQEALRTASGITLGALESTTDQARIAFDGFKLANNNAAAAVERAFDFGEQAQLSSRSAYAASLGFADAAVQASKDAAATVASAVKVAGDQTTGNRPVIITALAVAGIVGAIGVYGMLRKS